ncbi:nitrate reductase molybdenum cofactor assembly chaperone [Streptomyces cacaoi]|uniref:nitrate reductase molybdenum cofactor assembly chaperone n=1 Tax=Streptomyces cacaoi TaxID=1898 RepID=UPI003319E04D
MKAPGLPEAVKSARAPKSPKGPGVRRALHAATGLLLSYPGEDRRRTLAEATAALHGLPGEGPAAVRRFCTAMASVPDREAAEQYVATFDRSRHRTLHLTYCTDGDTRRRGASLVRLAQLYRAHGWEPADGELPDFLPVVLEFAARCPDAGLDVLCAHRAALTVLDDALTAHGSPYAALSGVVLGTLPRDRDADRAAAHARRQGPPTESVGLTPYGAPGGTATTAPGPVPLPPPAVPPRDRTAGREHHGAGQPPGSPRGARR